MKAGIVFAIAISLGFMLVTFQNQRHKNRIEEQKKQFILAGGILPSPSVKSSADLVSTPVSAQLSTPIKMIAQGAPVLQTLDPIKHSLLLRDVQKKLGDTLDSEKDSAGYLARLSSLNRENLQKADGFVSTDGGRVASRAQEVMDAVSPLVWQDGDTRFEPGSPTTGPVSGQMVYQQVWRGLRVQPQGNLSVDLGPRGEVLSVTSDVPSNLKVAEPLKDIGIEEAKKIARESVQKAQKSSADKVKGGSKIVWVTELGAHPKGRVAYDFLVSHFRVIVDSESSKVLWFKDVSVH